MRSYKELKYFEIQLFIYKHKNKLSKTMSLAGTDLYSLFEVSGPQHLKTCPSV